MNVIQWLETELDVGIVDIEHAAQTVGVEVVEGIAFLEKIFAPVAEALTAAGEILTIVDPPLAGIAFAITQIEGLISSSTPILESMVGQLGEPNTAVAAKDYKELLANFAKFKAIEAAQVASIQKALALIVPIAIKAKSATVAEIENALKSI